MKTNNTPRATPDPAAISSAEFDAMHKDIRAVMHNVTSGISLKHDVCPPEVCLTIVDVLSTWMRDISPQGTAQYFRAVAKITEEMTDLGKVSKDAADALDAALGQIQRDTKLHARAAEGQA